MDKKLLYDAADTFNPNEQAQLRPKLNEIYTNVQAEIELDRSRTVGCYEVPTITIDGPGKKVDVSWPLGKGCVVFGPRYTTAGSWGFSASDAAGTWYLRVVNGAYAKAQNESATGLTLAQVTWNGTDTLSALTLTILASRPGIAVVSGSTVTSVNEESGDVSLNTDKIPEGATNQYHTNGRVDARITAQKGQANGLASLGADGKVPTSQLPDIIPGEGDVVGPASSVAGRLAAFGGTDGKTLVDSGVAGASAQAAYNHSATTGNPHNTTPAQIGALPSSHTVEYDHTQIGKFGTRPVSSSAPTIGQVPRWDGETWVPDNAEGTGDMAKSVYDSNDNGKVDASETVSDGTNTATAAEVRAHLDAAHVTGPATSTAHTLAAFADTSGDVLEDSGLPTLPLAEILSDPRGYVYPQVKAILQEGSNVDLTTDDGAETVSIASTGGGTGVSDHGLLTGLTDDDHTQYHTDARGDARYPRLSTSGVTYLVATDGNNSTAGAAVQITGTVSITVGSGVVTGSSTLFTTELAVGQYVLINTECRKIASIANDTQLTVETAYTASASNVAIYKGAPFLTIQAAINSIPQVLNHAATVALAPGVYSEYATFSGFSGKGSINLYGVHIAATTCGVGALRLSNNALPITIRGIDVVERTVIGIYCATCANVWFNYLNHNGGSLDSIWAFSNLEQSNARFSNCAFSYTRTVFAIFLASRVILESNSGANNTVVCSAGQGGIIAKVNATQPGGTTAEFASQGGLIIRPSGATLGT
jgi:hypothetical protein